MAQKGGAGKIDLHDISIEGPALDDFILDEEADSCWKA